MCKSARAAPGVVLHNSLYRPPNHSLSCQRVQVYLPGPLGPWAFARATEVSTFHQAVMLLGWGSSAGEQWGLCRVPSALSQLGDRCHHLRSPWSPTHQPFCLFPRVLRPGGVQAGGEPWPEEVGDVAATCALAPGTGALV